MRRLDCSEAEELIIRGLDEGLDLERVARLEDHLLHCTSCRALKEETASLLKEIAADVPKDPGEEFWNRYHASLQAKLQDAQPVRTWGFGWKAAAALLAAGLVVAVIRLGSVTSRPPEIVDSKVALSLLSDLNQVYGPDQEEEAISGYPRDLILASLVGQVNGYDSGISNWFEVEDEPDNSFL
jgi:hypothetical protein